MDENLPNKNFFSNNFIVDVFLFVTAIISLLVTTLAIYLLCKNKKLRMLVTSLALQQRRHSSNTGRCQYSMYLQNSVSYNFGISISIFRLVIFIVLHSRKLKLCRGFLFSNAVKIMLFISDIQCYVPIKLCNTAGSIHLFKITGTIVLHKVTLKQNYIWDIIEKDWKEVNMTFNGNKINLPKSCHNKV